MALDFTVVEINGDADDPFGPCWGVLDPSSQVHDHFQAMLGTDVLPMADALPRYFVGPDAPFKPRKGFKVDHTRLTADQLCLACRFIARKTGMTEMQSFLFITAGTGMIVGVEAIHLCPDPDMGRAWWRAIAELRAQASSQQPTEDQP